MMSDLISADHANEEKIKRASRNVILFVILIGISIDVSNWLMIVYIKFTIDYTKYQVYFTREKCKNSTLAGLPGCCLKTIS